MISFMPGPSPTYKPMMIFIDGQYLRQRIKELFGNDKIKFDQLSGFLRSIGNFGLVQGDLIRLYYYDAIVEKEDNPKRYEEQSSYFEKIKKCNQYQVRLGRLKKTDEDDKYRQKGVDVLLAIDMISKAYENHYEIAVFVGGDNDFLDVIQAVKHAGKRVVGVYFEKNTSKELVESFDVKRCITHQEADNIIEK